VKEWRGYFIDVIFIPGYFRSSFIERVYRWSVKMKIAQLFNTGTGFRVGSGIAMIFHRVSNHLKGKKVGSDILIDAACRGDLELVKAELAWGAHPDSRDGRYWADNSTALMWAAQYGHQQILEELLKANAAVNLFDAAGNTALVRGAEHPKIVERLLEAGADLSQHNLEGYNAYSKTKQVYGWSSSLSGMLERYEELYNKAQAAQKQRDLEAGICRPPLIRSYSRD
jgi:hypothetical protein